MTKATWAVTAQGPSELLQRSVLAPPPGHPVLPALSANSSPEGPLAHFFLVIPPEHQGILDVQLDLVTYYFLLGHFWG